jgi:hypothetical protein
MINESALRGILVHLTKRQKAIYQSLTATMGEAASLRETVRALDPTFDDVLAQKREEFHSKLSEIFQSDMKHYDDLIRVPEAGEVC